MKTGETTTQQTKDPLQSHRKPTAKTKKIPVVSSVSLEAQ